MIYAVCKTQDASIPVVNQLSHRQMLKFAHLAHERGLITYLSAGIDASNLYKAVQVGIDGMGIGFALHVQAQGAVGALSRERINAVLDARDAAEKAVLGRAGKMLALLDYFAAFGVLTEAEDATRKALYNVMDQVGGWGVVPGFRDYVLLALLGVCWSS